MTGAAHWHDRIHSNSTHFDPIAHDGDIFPSGEIRSRRITGRAGLGVDFDSSLNQIDDPVRGDAALGVSDQLAP